MKQRSLTGFLTGNVKKRRKVNGQAPLKTVDNSRFATCPLCQACFPLHVLLLHADVCTGQQPEPLKTKERKSATPPAQPSVFNGSAETRQKEERRPWWTQQPPSQQQNERIIDNPIDPCFEPIPGLHLFPNFITEDEEKDILAELDGATKSDQFLPWKPGKFNGQSSGKRWGVHCNLRDRRVGTAENPLPHFYHKLVLPKLQRVVQLKACMPNEANAIDYRRKKGDWLASHVDDRQLSKEPIANLSLAGDCYMTFKNERNKGGEPQRVLLPRRTLQVLTGKARYDYSHGIRNEDLLEDRRVSVTMRESPLSNPRR